MPGEMRPTRPWRVGWPRTRRPIFSSLAKSMIVPTVSSDSLKEIDRFDSDERQASRACNSKSCTTSLSVVAQRWLGIWRLALARVLLRIVQRPRVRRSKGAGIVPDAGDRGHDEHEHPEEPP